MPNVLVETGPNELVILESGHFAAMARSGKKVMQFLEGGRYIGVVVNGNVHLYAGKK